jgi:polynucleotide kinase-phosphatase
MIIQVPELSLVLLMGASGSGKSTFARRHFRATEILSSDFCRGLVSDDESNQAATADAFAVLHLIAEKRLAAGKLTVIDATNVQKEARKPFLELAKSQNVLPVVIVLDVPSEICHAHNANRSDRQFGPQVVRQQVAQLKKSLRHLEAEGFRYRHLLSSPEEIEVATIERQPLWNNRKWDHGPFDMIGDVHGCYEELIELLERLGYTFAQGGVVAPLGRKAVFLGDLVDRGPMAPEVVELVRTMVTAGHALCVPGNHDVKFVRAARGRKVQLTHGLARTMEQYALRETVYRGELAAAAEFLDRLVSHYVLDEGRLVVAHAGLTEPLQGRSSGTVREFCLYGDVTGETDEEGYPVRRDWAVNYRGPAKVVYGHIVVPRAEWVNNTINIDTGCVFGGRLTALRYPEMELVSVPAHRVYVEGRVNFAPASRLSSQQRTEDVLDLEDFTAKRVIETSLMGNVTIREENSAAALEVMSRFAVAPQWLIYLPPTMSPCATAAAESFLEHPVEAFAYFAEHGVERVVCEQKHMGSRAVVIVGRSAEAIRQRFGFLSAHQVGLGMIYTRTGRRFFEDEAMEHGILEHLVQVLSSVDVWESLQTDWLCLDAELMPWSFKGAELLERQYAPVGAAAEVSLRAALELIKRTAGPELVGFGQVLAARAVAVENYRETYRRYCWAVTGWQDLKIAPFQILATEGRTYFDQPHRWHLEQAAAWASHDSHGVIIATDARGLNPSSLAECEAATVWWEELTRVGSEGMVVKPEHSITRHSGKLVQPGVKCRGREYLRLIYGPTYEEQLEQLRSRNLGPKRSLALREFTLGVEALERFVRREPLRRVHECVFGVLALESEPVDPRL